MLALQVAVKQRLEQDSTLGPILHYFVAPLNTELPYVEYWTGNGTPDTQAGFGEDGRDYDIFIQVSSRVGMEASEFYERAEALLRYQNLEVEGWQQRGKIVWLHQLDDPGDATQDNELVYYDGAAFRITLYRQRTD